MSALLMGRAFYVPLDQSSRLVLLALCDHANDDGTESRPGVQRIMYKTGLKERAVQGCLKHLEAHGLITAAGYRLGGYGRATNWTINALALRLFADWYEDDRDAYVWWVETPHDMRPSENYPAACDRKGCSVTQLTPHAGAPQPSGTIMNQADSEIEIPEGGIVAEFHRRIGKA